MLRPASPPTALPPTDPKEADMTFSRTLKGALLALLAVCAMQAQAWIRSPATTFAVLPVGTAHPEGITADAQGNLYVADFDVSKAAGPGNIVVFDRAGRLLRTLDVAGSSPLLLGIAFHPLTGALLVIDFGNRKVLTVDPQTGTTAPFATIPGGDAAGPNALAFDAAGDVYISDSFQGVIWKTGASGGAVSAWLSDPLLTTSGVPPFGANGMAFNKAGTALFVANTGNDTVVRVPVAGGAAGTPEVFVHSINGADGLLVDGEDNLWVAANQADEIVVLDPSGKVVAKLGDFDGIDPKGSPRGLLFPASLVMSNGFVYVTNLSLDLRLFGLPQTVDSQWAAAVTRHTVARIKAQIPPVQGR
jgi:DNA-binding beta-propeller fold protein YncE